MVTRRQERREKAEPKVIVPYFFLFLSACGFFVALCTILLLFAFGYHQFPTLVLFIAASFMLVSLAPLTAAHGPLLAASLVTGVLAATTGGLHCYYTYSLPLRALREGRTYNGVFPDQPAVAFADAAKLNFAARAMVDVTSGVGVTSLEVGVHTFCVAPIVDSSSNGRVEFWAAGLDCCSKYGNFVCDDAGDDGIDAGLVLSYRHDGIFDTFFGRLLSPPLMRRDLFLKAVADVEAVHGLVSSPNPVFVRWTKGSKQDHIEDARSRFGVALLVGFLCSAVGASLMTLPLMIVLRFRSFQSRHAGHVSRLAGLPVGTSPEVARFVNIVAPRASSTVRESFFFGLLAPWVVFIVSVVLWTWLRCLQNGDLAAALFAGLVVSVAAGLLQMEGKRLYGFGVLVAAVLGAFIGTSNYFNNTFHYCSVKDHRTYANVPPDASAAKYDDAGEIAFEKGTRVDSNRSVGFRRRGITYCAAPIVFDDGDATVPSSTSVVGSPEHVDFWAVGTDCCDARGNFRCASDSRGPPGGLVIRDGGIGDDLHENFVRVARAAAESNGILPPEKPMLVRWEGDVNALRSEWVGKAMGVCLLSAAVGLIVIAVIFGLSLALTRFQRRLALERAKSRQMLLAAQNQREAEERAEMAKAQQQQQQQGRLC
eukprot:TRINITY_DN10791_c0_g1_i1.p1 TRINITY_DN10791_c0_g1~~TRINITY_DN10791_c0_g1_i1.p1  ORF type:complete len:651 (-),score=118.68 TRINITY_DN10791_c0_g1_i1:104-2056(-)